MNKEGKSLLLVIHFKKYIGCPPVLVKPLVLLKPNVKILIEIALNT